jgi:hypothetical protein
VPVCQGSETGQPVPALRFIHGCDAGDAAEEEAVDGGDGGLVTAAGRQPGRRKHGG